MGDITFHSAALNRDMQYRVILPASVAAGQKLPVIYLLHGGGAGFPGWSNCSGAARYAEHTVILGMPEGNSSYYTNSAERPQDRYEDYIVTDLIADVESKFPVASGRSNRAIVGVSMGGFGAVKLALRHPELFVFAAGISPAVDVPSRPFSIKRIQQWRFHSSIFGPWGSQTRRDNDPFVLARVRRLARVGGACFSPAENRKACCRRIALSPRCLKSATFNTSFIPRAAGMSGTRGTGGYLICFKAFPNTQTQRSRAARR